MSFENRVAFSMNSGHIEADQRLLAAEQEGGQRAAGELPFLPTPVGSEEQERAGWDGRST